MNDVARQENGEPMLTMDATIFHKLLVDKVIAVDQKEYEVFLIAASVHGQFQTVHLPSALVTITHKSSPLSPSADKLELLKLTHIPARKGSDKSFLIQASPLNRNGSGGSSQEVGKMELYRTDNEVRI